MSAFPSDTPAERGPTFVKMNGLGNDFVIVAGGPSFAPSPGQARAIADRATGIGCDQIIALSPSTRADAFMRIWNADGGEVAACGNAARCVGWLLLRASGAPCARIETAAGVLEASAAGEEAITLDMGRPGLNWRDIPLARAMETRTLDFAVEGLPRGPGAVSMGNPHVVFFVTQSDADQVRALGPSIEHDPLFPERVNVGFAEVRAPDVICLRVWERGAGLTAACGTGACAAVVAAHRRGLTGRIATVRMDGGALRVEWRESDDHVLMTGPTCVEFTGRLPALETSA